MTQDKIKLQLDRIGNEVTRAMQLHQPINSTHEAYAVILEELEEFWKEVKINPKHLSVEAQHKRILHMQVELLQIAAMCIRTTIDCHLMGYALSKEYIND